MDFSICLLDPGLDSHIWSRGLVYLHQHCFPVNTTNHTAIQPSNHQRPGIRYSSTVVAPMQRNSPRASMGFLLAIQQLDSGQMSNVFQCHDIVIQIIPFKFIAVSFFFGTVWWILVWFEFKSPKWNPRHVFVKLSKTSWWFRAYCWKQIPSWCSW